MYLVGADEGAAVAGLLPVPSPVLVKLHVDQAEGSENRRALYNSTRQRNSLVEEAPFHDEKSVLLVTLQ